MSVSMGNLELNPVSFKRYFRKSRHGGSKVLPRPEKQGITTGCDTVRRTLRRVHDGPLEAEGCRLAPWQRSYWTTETRHQRNFSETAGSTPRWASASCAYMKQEI